MIIYSHCLTLVVCTARRITRSMWVKIIGSNTMVVSRVGAAPPQWRRYQNRARKSSEHVRNAAWNTKFNFAGIMKGQK